MIWWFERNVGLTEISERKSLREKEKNKDVEIVKENYNENAQSEWERLEGFHFEFEITKHFWKVSARQNRSWHRRWAGQIQHTACLTGVRRGSCRSERKQYCSRKQKFREYGVLINAYVCDARDLSALNLSTFDNVLIMGPMYHLPDAEDRKKCVLQAKKYLAKNWVLFASFITITVGLNYYIDTAPELLLHEPAMDLFDRMEIDESWSGTAFTKATFINTTEVLTFFDELGFKKLALLEQEGLTGPRLTEIEK